MKNLKVQLEGSFINMAKTRFTETKRDIVYSYMMKQYDKKQETAKLKNNQTIEKLKARAVEIVNKAIVKKYSESDIAVLQKYGFVRTDLCIKLIDAESRQIFGVEFPWVHGKTDIENEHGIAKVPSRGGCGSGDVFEVSPKEREAVENYTMERNRLKDARRDKCQEYRSFLSACRYVEDAHEVVPFPKDMQDRLMSGAALIAINPEIIDSIKKEFAA